MVESEKEEARGRESGERVEIDRVERERERERERQG